MSNAESPRADQAPSGLVILGSPIAQSLSPVFQAAALEASGIAVRYARRETTLDELSTALADCAAQRIGGNVTMPLKEAVAARATRLSRTATRVGAVNTFWFEHGALIGHNTDVDGVRATLNALRAPGTLGPVVLLGAGGSAAAVLVALAQHGCGPITIVARTPARAEDLLVRTQIRDTTTVLVLTPDDSRVMHALGEASLVINSTPVGMRDEARPVPLTALGPQTAVFDLVYRADSTAFVRDARARGLQGEDGLRMLVEQGAAAFRCWFGIDAPRAIMWQALGRSMPSPDRPRA